MLHWFIHSFIHSILQTRISHPLCVRCYTRMLAVQIMNLTLRDETLTTDFDKNRGKLEWVLDKMWWKRKGKKLLICFCKGRIHNNRKCWRINKHLLEDEEKKTGIGFWCRQVVIPRTQGVHLKDTCCFPVYLLLNLICSACLKRLFYTGVRSNCWLR